MSSKPSQSVTPFSVLEATIDDIHSAYKSGQLTSRQLVRIYLDRIEAYDKKGPAINAIITVNSRALEEADRLDAAFKASGFVGPLHPGLDPPVLQELLPGQRRLCCGETEKSRSDHFSKSHPG